MDITLSLSPEEEQKLYAKARATGTTPEQLLKQAIEPILAEPAEETLPKPKKSMFGVLSKYGPAPSAEEIDENRREMFANFGEYDDIA